MRRLAPLPLFALLLLTTACPDDPVNPPRPDAGTPTGDTGVGPDTGVPPRPDGGMTDPDGGQVVTGCQNPPLTPPANGICEVSAGNANLLLQGNIIVPGGILENGAVLVDGTGNITCAACDCADMPAAAGATKIACANGVISPALINAHDHITFTEAPPAPHADKYDHRHQWRRGQDGLPRIPSVQNQGGNRGIWWGELRNLMAGATSINGSGGAAGLLRNLDQAGDAQEGLNQARVAYETFPLGDSGGERLSSGCGYPMIDDPAAANITGGIAYTPHISEGIDDTARNEYLCLSMDTMGGNDVILDKTSIVHGIGLLGYDFRDMAASRAKLIWSPRSNIDLYGNTAQIVLARNTGVRVALGSDWAISGSMNILRELVCADEFNERNLGGALSDRELFDMATVNAAAALGSESKLGTLAPGFVADITVWNGTSHKELRAILDADPKDVVLVLRGGSALYGDQTVMAGLPDTAPADCETLDVCGVNKAVCARRETGSTIADMQAAIAANAYPLFFCDAPDDEPTCIPFRSDYTGMPMAGDMDGDGVADATDNCPSIFNPARPMDDGSQANVDADADGDACDVCPTDADTTTCERPDPLDIDGDMVPNTMDNCPNLPNMDQADRDTDMIGDLCDACPDEPNVGNEGCSASIYEVKQGLVTGPVKINNALVTAVAGNGFFAQVVPGDAEYDLMLAENYSGLFTFVGAMGTKPAEGDRVDIVGSAVDFFGQLEVDASSGSVTTLSSNNTLPAPIVVMPAEIATSLDGVHGPRAEALEAVLVEVQSVSVTNVDPPQTMGDSTPRNEFLVDGDLRVDDYMYTADPFPAVGERLVYVRGVLRFNFENYRLEPRSAFDVGTTERLVGIAPAFAYVPSGINGVPPGGLAVLLNRPASSDIVVSLTSSTMGTQVPPMVTIAANSASADIPLNIGLMERGAVEITASYNNETVRAQLVIYDDAQPRTIDTFLIAPALLPANQVASGQVELSLPGQLPNGSTVVLSANPPGIVTLSETQLVIPPGETRALFDVVAGTSTGAVTVTASIGASLEYADVEVYVPTARSPGPGDLVITEVFRNPNGADEQFREWFEVHNVTGVEIIVDGITVADLARSQILTTPNGERIPPDGYAVFAYSDDPAVNGGVTAIAAYGVSMLQLNNGSETLTVSYGGMTVDTISYAAGWPGAAQGVAMCLRYPYPMDNSVQAAWGDSVGNFGSVATEQGSPGVASNSTNCP